MWTHPSGIHFTDEEDEAPFSPRPTTGLSLQPSASRGNGGPPPWTAQKVSIALLINSRLPCQQPSESTLTVPCSSSRWIMKWFWLPDACDVLSPVLSPASGLWAQPRGPCPFTLSKSLAPPRTTYSKPPLSASCSPACPNASSCWRKALPDTCFLLLQLLLWSITSSGEPSSSKDRDDVCALDFTPIRACPNWKLPSSFFPSTFNFASPDLPLDFINFCH